MSLAPGTGKHTIDGGNPTPPQTPEPTTWSPESFDPARLADMIEDLTPSEEQRQGRAMGVHIIDGLDPRSDVGRYIEAEVFREFFPSNDLDLMRREYGPYDATSTFLTVLDYENKQPVGVIRMTRPEGAGLKSLDDLVAADSPWANPAAGYNERLQEMGNDYEHSADIATFAVMPDYRSGHAADGASASLYSTSVRWSLANGYPNWISIIDQKPLGMIQEWGEPFEPFEGCDFAPFLDSKASLPVHLNLPVALAKIRQTLGDELGGGIVDLYTKGSGLHQTFVLPDFN